MDRSPLLHALSVRLLGLTIGSVLALAGAEAILRLTATGTPWKRTFMQDGAVLVQTPAAVFDPQTGARFTPGWRGRFYYNDGADFVAVQANRLGFRSPEYAEDNAMGARRVALLGDSMMVALQVEADAHVRSLLEGALLTDGPTEVFNFGIHGTGPVTHLHAYRLYAARFHPGVVVLGIYTDNDFTDNEHVTWQHADGSLVEAPFAHAPGNLKKFLKANSSLVLALWAIKRGVLDHAAQGVRIGGPDQSGPNAATERPIETLRLLPSHQLAQVSEPAYTQALAVWDELLRELQASSTHAIVVMFPDLTHFVAGTGWDYARSETKLLHERLAAHFTERGATVVTGSEMLARHSAWYGSTPWTKWKNYLSEQGHKALASLLAERVRSFTAANTAASVPGGAGGQ